jgi:hypothetical protein
MDDEYGLYVRSFSTAASLRQKARTLDLSIVKVVQQAAGGMTAFLEPAESQIARRDDGAVQYSADRQASELAVT